MTWEDIYEKMIKYDVFGDNIQCKASVLAILEGELHNKVIIEKGENRHPDSDIIHLGVEGLVELQQFCFNSWDNVNYTPHVGWKYRIKPPEPVYEYDVKFKFKDGKSFIVEGLTFDEMHEFAKNIKGDRTYILLSNTKRERKND